MDSDDDVPLMSLASKSIAKKMSTAKQTTSSGNISDDSDDVPLMTLVSKNIRTKVKKDPDAELARRLALGLGAPRSKNGIAKKTSKTKGTSKSAPTKKRKRAAVTTPAKTKKKTTNSSKSKSTGGSSAVKVSISTGAGAPTDDKSKLVYGILRRWEYCLPSRKQSSSAFKKEMEATSASKNFIACGFEGVFVGVRGDAIGIIKDNRRSGKFTPCYKALMKNDASELQKMLLSGIDAQISDLAHIYGPGSSFEDAVGKERKAFARINAAKAETRHAKLLAKKRKK